MENVVQNLSIPNISHVKSHIPSDQWNILIVLVTVILAVVLLIALVLPVALVQCILKQRRQNSQDIKQAPVVHYSSTGCGGSSDNVTILLREPPGYNVSVTNPAEGWQSLGGNSQPVQPVQQTVLDPPSTLNDEHPATQDNVQQPLLPPKDLSIDEHNDSLKHEECQSNSSTEDIDLEACTQELEEQTVSEEHRLNTQHHIDTICQEAKRRRFGENKEIYKVLRGIYWVQAYYSEGASIEVYVDLEVITKESALLELMQVTGHGEEKFHILNIEDMP